MDFLAEFFEHSALDDPRHQLRLLRVQPGGEDSDISCELLTYDMKQTPSYQAVSYIWGDPNNLRSVLVNGKRLVVRYNCWNVLRQARTYVTKDGECPFLWIDAICINQNDLIEKSAQVQMMGAIFERAEHVLVCPGPPSDDTSFLSNQVASVEKIIDKLKNERPVQGTVETDPIQDAVRKWIGSLHERELVRITKSIFELESRPYWSRAWVVQELRLARDKLLVCGSGPIQILTVREVIRQFVQSKTPLGKTQQELYGIQPDLDRLSEMAGLERGAVYRLTMEHSLLSRRVLPGSINFSGISLDSVQQLKCSDTRDRIFALTRVLQWSTETGPPATEYTKTPFEVAVDAIMRVGTDSMHQTTGLDLIANMLNVMDISIQDLRQYFPTGLAKGTLNAIVWRSEDSLPHLNTCVQCKSEKRAYKLKVPILYWAPIERNEQGYLTIATVDTIVPANDPAVEAFFSAVKVKGDHTPGPNLATPLSHDIDGISPLILSSQSLPDRPQQLLGMVKSSTRPGDLVVEIFEDRHNEKQHSCRHLILHHIGDDVYEISGHAFLPANISCAKYPDGRHRDWHEKTVLRMSIDVEDAMAYFVETSDRLDLVQQVKRSFCLRSGSSFGKTRPRSDGELDRQRRPYMSGDWNDHDPEVEKMYNFCLHCGRRLNRSEVK